MEESMLDVAKEAPTIRGIEREVPMQEVAKIQEALKPLGFQVYGFKEEIGYAGLTLFLRR